MLTEILLYIERERNLFPRVTAHLALISYLDPFTHLKPQFNPAISLLLWCIEASESYQSRHTHCVS